MELHHLIGPVDSVLAANDSTLGVTSTYVSMNDFNRVMFNISVGAGTLTKVELVKATAATGTGAVAFREHANLSSAANARIPVEAFVGELGNADEADDESAYKFIAVKLTGGTSNTVTAIRYAPRYEDVLGWGTALTISNMTDQV